MFLTAVLQAHTDTLPPNRAEAAPAPAREAKEAAVTMPAQLEKALALPLAERLQSLPSVHRSRWV
jgi:hypothetical protein